MQYKHYLKILERQEKRAEYIAGTVALLLSVAIVILAHFIASTSL
jgi:hypothetical protein